MPAGFGVLQRGRQRYGSERCLDPFVRVTWARKRRVEMRGNCELRVFWMLSTFFQLISFNPLTDSAKAHVVSLRYVRVNQVSKQTEPSLGPAHWQW